MVIYSILVIGIIFIYRIDGLCQIQGKTARCPGSLPGNLPNFINGLVIEGCDNQKEENKENEDNQTMVFQQFPSIQTLTIDCPIDWKKFPNVTQILYSRSGCSPQKTLPWIDYMQANTEFQRKLNLKSCDLACNCQNLWLASPKSQKIQQIMGLPEPIVDQNWTCDFSKCPRHSIGLPQEIIVDYGQKIDIQAKIPISSSNSMRFKQYFRYLTHSKPKFREEISVSKGFVRFEVDNATEDHMASLAFFCWTCQQPQLSIITVRVRRNVTMVVSRIDEGHEDQREIMIHGWPLHDLSITLLSNDSEWPDEKYELTEEKLYFRNGSLVLSHIHSLFYLKTYIFFARQCTHCEHNLPRGDYSLLVCTNVSCAQKNIHLTAPNQKVTNQTQLAAVRVKSSSTPISLWPYLLISPILVLCALCMCVKNSTLAKLLQFVRISTGKKQGDGKIRIRSKMQDFTKRFRRTSRATEATEETTLRMEERGSLCVSDYTGHLIPVISLGNIQIKEKIGQGAFGEVYRALWTSSNDREVAVKTINGADNETEKEAQVLSKLDHPNIVRLFGMTRDGNRILLVLEMMNRGDLKNYLRIRKPHPSNYTQFPAALELKELLFIIREIIQGLCYLNSQQIVHRDLAARNCLVSGEDDSRICMPSNRPPFSVKISDFGMSRRLYSQNEYYKMQTSGSLLPVRWLPPESLNSCRFSHQSDIWALGVTMWEIFTYGETPFSDLSNNEVVALGLSGVKPSRPSKCPQEIYELMEKCWVLDPEKRISAEDAMLEPCLQAPMARPRTEVTLSPLCFEVDVPDDIAPLISNAQI